VAFIIGEYCTFCKMVNQKTLGKKRTWINSKPLRFFVSPTFKNPKITFQKKIQNVKLALKFEFRWLLIWMSFPFVDIIIAQLLNTKPILGTILSGHRGFKDLSNEKLILLAVIIAPIVEELAFRGFMDFKKLTISLSVSAFVCSFLRMFFRSYFEWGSLLVVAIVMFSIAFFILRLESIYNYITDKRMIVFYSMSILFALAHLNNYSSTTFSGFNLLLIPYAVLPQFIGSISLAFIRLKNGLVWSMALHCLLNLIVVTIYILGHHPHS
jgi:membrane protease YdiL (CAAX protease family)